MVLAKTILYSSRETWQLFSDILSHKMRCFSLLPNRYFTNRDRKVSKHLKPQTSNHTPVRTKSCQ